MVFPSLAAATFSLAMCFGLVNATQKYYKHKYLASYPDPELLIRRLDNGFDVVARSRRNLAFQVRGVHTSGKNNMNHIAKKIGIECITLRSLANDETIIDIDRNESRVIANIRWNHSHKVTDEELNAIENNAYFDVEYDFGDRQFKRNYETLGFGPKTLH